MGNFAQPASLIMSDVVDLTSVIWGSDAFYVVVIIKKSIWVVLQVCLFHLVVTFLNQHLLHFKSKWNC